MFSKLKNKIAKKCINFLYINNYITNDMFLDCSGYMIKYGKYEGYRIWNVGEYFRNKEY